MENLGIIGLLCRSVGNPRRYVDLHQGVGYLTTTRSRFQNGTPLVRHDASLLGRELATVHKEQFLDCCSRSLVFVH